EGASGGGRPSASLRVFDLMELVAQPGGNRARRAPRRGGYFSRPKRMSSKETSPGPVSAKASAAAPSAKGSSTPCGAKKPYDQCTLQMATPISIAISNPA